MSEALTITELRVAMARFTGAFDADLISASDAARVQGHATAIKNMAATVEALAGARVAATDAWRREGDASPAHQLARKSGTSLTKARQVLETGARMAALPEVAAAARAGELSAEQAAPIAEAATKAPGSERRLMDLAGRSSLGELRDECERTKAAAEPDDEAREKAIHRGRFARKRNTADGGGEITYHSTRAEVAEMWGIITGFAGRVFNEARNAGRRESSDAYAADGMLDMARTAAAAAAGASRPAESAARPDGLAEATGASLFPDAGDDATDGPSGSETVKPAPPPAEDATDDPAPGEHGLERPVVVGRPKVVPPKVIVRVDWDALVLAFRSMASCVRSQGSVRWRCR